MQIVVLRHGRDQPGQGNERILSVYGKASVEAKAAELRELLKEPVNRLLSSPAERAKQTAETLALSIRPPSPPVLEIDNALAEEEGLEGLQEAVRKALVAGETTVLVGHNPAITALFCELKREQGDEQPDECIIGNGEGVLIEVSADREVVEALRV